MEDRATDIPLNDVEKILEDKLALLPNMVGNRFRNAFKHLRKAWLLLPIDTEMSAFRAITAEEEAATALILALKMRQYPGADVLKYNNHVHKSAVFFIMREANNFLAEGRKVPFETYLHTIGPHPDI